MRRTAAASRPWRRLVAILAILALLPSWLGLLGDWNWLLDLMSHFRWQYLLAAAVVMAWSLTTHHRHIALFASLTLLLNVALIGRLAWHPDITRAQLAQDFQLQVLALNVLTENQQKQAVLRQVLEADADVVVLIEVDDSWLQGLASLDASYAWRVKEPRANHFGMAVYSRIPFTRQQLWSLAQAPGPTIAVSFDHMGRQFTLVGLHPMSPGGPRRSRARDAVLASLAQRVSQLGEPALVVGDFNATPWSAGMRLATAGNLGFRSLTPPWAPTWRVYSPVALPIDHALCTAPLVITHRDVLPDMGSDHRGVSFTVAWAI